MPLNPNGKIYKLIKVEKNECGEVVKVFDSYAKTGVRILDQDQEMLHPFVVRLISNSGWEKP